LGTPNNSNELGWLFTNLILADAAGGDDGSLDGFLFFEWLFHPLFPWVLIPELCLFVSTNLPKLFALFQGRGFSGTFLWFWRFYDAGQTESRQPHIPDEIKLIRGEFFLEDYKKDRVVM
jgi:hypothetical protein